MEDSISLEVLRVGCEAELQEECVDARLVGPEPGRSQVEAVLRAESSAYAVAGFQNDHRPSSPDQLTGSGQARDSCSDNHRVKHVLIPFSTMPDNFPDLPTAWMPTRDSLRSYAQILGAIRRNLVPPDPRWWHISLQAIEEGLTTGGMEVAGGGELALTLDLGGHRLTALRGGEMLEEWPLDGGLSSAILGRRVLEAVRGCGAEVSDNFNPKEDDERRAYVGAAAESYVAAQRSTRDVLASVREGLEGEVGPVQLWPHHFDLSFEWFGTRKVSHEEGGQVVEAPSQIGFGFSTGDDSHPAAYYYATPWPFEKELAEAPLPNGALWHSEGWEGGLLPYEAVRREGGDLLASYFERVYEVASPRLTDT